MWSKMNPRVFKHQVSDSKSLYFRVKMVLSNEKAQYPYKGFNNNNNTTTPTTVKHIHLIQAEQEQQQNEQPLHDVPNGGDGSVGSIGGLSLAQPQQHRQQWRGEQREFATATASDVG